MRAMFEDLDIDGNGVIGESPRSRTPHALSIVNMSCTTCDVMACWWVRTDYEEFRAGLVRLNVHPAKHGF